MDHDHHSQHHASTSGHAHGSANGMQMAFQNSIYVTLWFEQWTTKTPMQYLLGMMTLVLLALAHEGLACYRSHAMARLSKVHDGVGTPSRHTSKVSMPDKLTLASLYALNLVSGYLLMLAVMTYNVGYFLAVTAGLGIGYIVFFDKQASHLAMARSDNCHVRLLDGE